MRPHQQSIIGYMIVAVVIIACICGMRTTALAQEKEEVAYRLKWLFNVSVVGDLWADVNGNFAKNGLKVAGRPLCSLSPCWPPEPAFSWI